MKNNMEKKLIYDSLLKVVSFDGSINELKVIISTLPWDSDEDIFIINEKILLNVLNKFINDNVVDFIIEEWANLLESREDIGYTNDLLKDIVDELANPVLYGQVNKETLNKYVNIINLGIKEM